MILPHLKAGGAERVVSFLFKKLDHTLFEPFLLVIGFKNDSHYKLDDENVIFLNKEKLRFAVLSIIKMIFKIKPSIVFSSIGHINLYLGFLKLFFPKIKFVVREASVYNEMMAFNNRRQLPKFISEKLYRNLDAIVYQSKDMRVDFENTFNVESAKGYLIHNPITLPIKKINDSRKKFSNIRFIIVGSLVANKGHMRVLKLFEKIKFSFTLEIIGEGPLKKDLEEYLIDSPISNKVFFRGLQSNVEQFYESADFLIQGSYVEGFPNVVLEALAYGIPCIIFDAPGGHKELIYQSENGYFIYNNDDADSVIEKSVNLTWDRRKIQNDVVNRFSANKIIKDYENMYKKTVEA